MKRYGKWLIPTVVSALIACGFAVQCTVLMAGIIRVGGPCRHSEHPSLDEIDHSGLDRLLARYVDQRGMVDYAGWKKSRQDLRALEDYLKSIGCVDLRKSASRQAKLAFWINAYNALTLNGMLREYPTDSIRNHTARLFGYNIWQDLQVWVDGDYYFIEQMEHEILRPMSEPRIHFAIVCASIGCPKLRNEAYTLSRLEEQLDSNARDFFADRNKFRADARSRTLYVSPILKWFGGDFGRNQGEVLRFIAPYLPSESARKLALQRNARVRYLDYDWGINEQPRSR